MDCEVVAFGLFTWEDPITGTLLAETDGLGFVNKPLEVNWPIKLVVIEVGVNCTGIRGS